MNAFQSPGAAMVDALDKRILISLRDNSLFVGDLRSFDQYGNLVLENSVKRMVVGIQFCDVPRGLQIIRGENIVLFGEVDPYCSIPPELVRVSETEIREAMEAEKEQERLKGSMRGRFDFLDSVME